MFARPTCIVVVVGFNPDTVCVEFFRRVTLSVRGKIFERWLLRFAGPDGDGGSVREGSFTRGNVSLTADEDRINKRCNLHIAVPALEQPMLAKIRIIDGLGSCQWMSVRFFGPQLPPMACSSSSASYPSDSDPDVIPGPSKPSVVTCARKRFLRCQCNSRAPMIPYYASRRTFGSCTLVASVSCAPRLCHLPHPSRGHSASAIAIRLLGHRWNDAASDPALSQWNLLAFLIPRWSRLL